MSAADLGSLPAGVIAVLAVIGALEIGLDVVALVDLYRRPAAQVALGNKWIWVAIILLANLIGAILYLAIARRPAPVVESAVPAERSAGAIQDVVDSLYGKEQNPGPS